MNSASPLDNLTIANPCLASWDRMEMRGESGVVRHCQSCQKNVYNLSMMSRGEATALIQQHEGKMCVRFAKRADGTLISGDCPVGQRTKRRRRGWTIAAVLAALIPSPISSMLKRASAATLRAVPAVSLLENTPAGEKVFTWLDPAGPPFGAVVMGNMMEPMPVTSSPAPIAPMPQNGISSSGGS